MPEFAGGGVGVCRRSAAPRCGKRPHADGPAGVDSTGPVSFYDKCTWQKNPSDGITITLATLVSRSGPGLGSVGDQYIATIQPDPSGLQLLYLHPIGPGQSVTTYCTPQEMKARNAPAPCRT